jgi:hypothetical protein
MKYFLILTSSVLFFSCNSAQQERATQTQKEKQEEVFPVGLFFREQIHRVDSLKLPTVKITTIRGKTSTEAISMEEFRLLAEEFVQADISDRAVKNAYKENSFADQSIPSVTLTYSTPDSSKEIQRLDVVIKPDPVRDDRVSSIYIEKHVRLQDTSVVKKMYWKANDNFQVITSKRIPAGKEFITQVKVSWSGMN